MTRGLRSFEALQALAGHRSIALPRRCLHLGADWLASEYRRAAKGIEVAFLLFIDPLHSKCE